MYTNMYVVLVKHEVDFFCLIVYGGSYFWILYMKTDNKHNHFSGKQSVKM